MGMVGGLFGEASDKAVEQDCRFHVSVDFDPACGGEDFLHGFLGADDQEVDHVSGIAFFVSDAAGDFGEERIVNSGHGR
jgi:hypothetical protein